MKEIKIVIAEDHEPSRRILRRFIEPLSYTTIVGEAADGEELIQQVISHRPNLVLVDINMPKLNGIHAIKECIKTLPQLKVVFITGHNEYAVEAFDIAAVDYVVKPIERVRLTQAIEKARAIINMSLELDEARHQTEYLAYHDALSGLPNRRFFEDRLALALSDEQAKDLKLAVISLDLDRFKNVNDSMGHAVGDLLLQSVADRLKQCVNENDTISRNGGDEFTILLEHIGDTKDVDCVVEEIYKCLKQPFLLEKHDYHVTTSMGIALYPDDGESVEDLMKNADVALHHAKDLGRGIYKFYTSEIHEDISQKLILESGLRKAIERNEFIIHYQPQINVITEEVIGMEALIRWEHPELGLVYPLEFIPLAEETGLIIPIGEWVLRHACQQAKKWQNEYHTSFILSVNLSLLQFQEDGLVQMIEGILKETNLDPQWLELEITESIAMFNADMVIMKLTQLRMLGVKIAIDDFGTGYSSLSYLKRFPINTLKIDRSFIKDIMTDSDDEAMIETIISMASNLKFKVIAEGVETDGQLSFLRNLNCNAAQGYLFSKPLPEHKFAEYIQLASDKRLKLT